MVAPPRSGGRTGRMGVLLLSFFLSGCMGSTMRYSDVPPPDYWYANGFNSDSHVHTPMSEQYSSASRTGDEGGGSYTYGAPTFTEAGADGCSIGDRFDHRATLAYNFDERHQLALNMRVNDDSGSMGVSRAVVVFRYKFPAAKASRTEQKHAKCRYDSHWQGLVGSTYNELFLRDHNSLWGQIKDNRLDFWNK
jgi:hypothetical protein